MPGAGGGGVPGMAGALGMSMRFGVRIDGISLGSWSSCKGLEMSCTMHKIREGGGYEFEHILFADITYPAIKLERAMESASAIQLRTWLTTELRTPPGLQTATAAGKTATITLLDPAWRPVATWTLRGVYPKAWVGPTLAAGKSAVAIERLELVHEGFL